MIAARTVAVLTAAPQSLFTLLGIQDGLRGHASVQLIAGAAVVNYGTKASQPITLAAGATSAVLPVGSLKDLHLTGTADVGIVVFYTHS